MRGAPGVIFSAIHISKASQTFIENLEDCFQPGDIILARIYSLKANPPQLTTAEEELGVILAKCEICKGTLKKEGEVLRCPRCNRIERRKVSMRYGEVVEWK